MDGPQFDLKRPPGFVLWMTTKTSALTTSGSSTWVTITGVGDLAVYASSYYAVEICIL